MAAEKHGARKGAGSCPDKGVSKYNLGTRLNGRQKFPITYAEWNARIGEIFYSQDRHFTVKNRAKLPFSRNKVEECRRHLRQ
jgi:hypothetical protein